MTASGGYDYLTWKTINQLIELIQSQINYQSDNREEAWI